MLHLIKLCVGVRSVEELEEWRADRQARGLGRPDGLNAHRTRMRPKRADEIIGRGSLYWVIDGAIRGRQPVVALDAGNDPDGRVHCQIVMTAGVIRTVPQPKRPFQGWRYLTPQDAPDDLNQASDEEAGALIDDLARLGLL